MIKAQALKGFRDFLPEQAIKRQYVVTKIKEVFERFGFDPLETPALEYAETLMGKYGDEADKLLYLFEDNGGRKVGMRYDQTVPLSRVIAQYQNLPMPFKRYQIQPVWRAENTQKGRFREFLQCDIDTIGTDSPLADAEIINCMLTVAKSLGFVDAVVSINDRALFDELSLQKKEIIILDKLEKIGKDAVITDLERSGREGSAELFEKLRTSQPTPRLSTVFETLKNAGFREEIDFRFDPFIARGLDYYTSTIFEMKVASYSSGSVAGGGRYDRLIGTFLGRDIPAIGVSFGFDRLVEALTEKNLLPQRKTASRVLVSIFAPEQYTASVELVTVLQKAGINAEVYPDMLAKLDKQLKYADRKGIPYVIIRGPEEQSKGVIKLKDMINQTQEEVTVDQVVERMTAVQ